MTDLVAEYIAALSAVRARFLARHSVVIVGRCRLAARSKNLKLNRINGLVAEYIVTLGTPRVRFPAAAHILRVY